MKLVDRLSLVATTRCDELGFSAIVLASHAINCMRGHVLVSFGHGKNQVAPVPGKAIDDDLHIDTSNRISHF